MSIKENPDFDVCLQLAEKAKSLREAGMEDEAQQVEKLAVRGFQKLILETREKLAEQIQKQKKNLQILVCESEYLGKAFCIQIGHEVTNPFINYRDSQEFFNSRTEDTGRYLECKLCGWTNKSEVLNNSNYFWNRKIANHVPKYDGNLIKSKVVRSLECLNESENAPEWKKTAEKFLEVQKEMCTLKEQIASMEAELKEICCIFGHDAEKSYKDKYEEVYTCICCGKKMDSTDYISSHYDVKLNGGIVPYYYWDARPILT